MNCEMSLLHYEHIHIYMRLRTIISGFDLIIKWLVFIVSPVELQNTHYFRQNMCSYEVWGIEQQIFTKFLIKLNPPSNLTALDNFKCLFVDNNL